MDVTMSKIVIRMNNPGGELDRREVNVEGDPQDEACAKLVAQTLVEMILDCGVIHPGDSFTVEATP
jgi:hypothetical protein